MVNEVTNEVRTMRKFRNRIIAAWYCLLGRGVMSNMKFTSEGGVLDIRSSGKMALLDCEFVGIELDMSGVKP